MKNKLLLIITTFICLNTFAQPEKWKAKKHFTIVSYNVENLFDTIDTAHKNDSEFTPTDKKEWNTERYDKKIRDISFVLSEINKNELPELIGLIEVENESPLKDLIVSDNLKAGNYNYILEDGPDPRGIDCALLYRQDIFKYLSHRAIPVAFPFSNNKRTRDILYAKGLVNKDTIHVFVNHWTSRRGGQDESEAKRVYSATVLKATCDSILNKNKQANIIIMGDFNDQPNNKSLNQVLDAGKVNENTSFVNLVFDLFEQGKGTYYYQGEYNMLDNLIINSASFNKEKGFRLYEKQAFIFNPESICFTNKNGDKSPSKTYGGNTYYGGFSDHFPIYTFFYEK